MDIMTNSIITAQGATTPATSIADLVTQYRHYARKTVENIILLGKTVYEADKFLSQNDFKAFCNEVNLDSEGPTYRKLRIIGKMSERFNDHIDMMPNSWTTVYELAKINDDAFAKLIDGNVLNKDITSKEIKQALDANESGKIVENIVNLTLKLEAKNPEMMFQMERDLKKIAQIYGARVKIDKEELHNEWQFKTEHLDIAA